MKRLSLIYFLLCLFGTPVARAEFRTWTEKATGRTITAELRGVTESKARLVLQSGRAHDVEIMNLSDEDLAYLAEQGHFDLKGHQEKEKRAQLQAQVEGVVLGKLLHENDFEEMISSESGWVHGNGNWSVENGELQGKEDPAQHHVAAALWRSKFKDVVVFADCKFSGATSITYRFDAEKGHLGGFSIEAAKKRVVIPRQNYTRSDATPPTWLGSSEHEVEQEEWYPVILQSIGDTWTIHFDGKVYQGTDASCALEKTSFGFIVAGQSAFFRNLSIWEASADAEKGE